MNAITKKSKLINQISPNLLGTLRAEDKEELFNQVSKLQGERVLMGRAAIKVSWIIGISGLAIGLAGMVCAATLFPLRTRDVIYVTENPTTGAAAVALGAVDAPSSFNERTDQYWLQRYLEDRENYVFQTDPLAFHRVTLMSAPDEQLRYKAMHDAAESPAKKLRDQGYVQIGSFEFMKLGEGRAQTLQYVVKFERSVMRSGQPPPPKGDPYTATITFQYHPEYPVSLPDMRLNPNGLQVLAYQVDNDAMKVR